MLTRTAHTRYDPARIARERTASITVCVPTRDEADTIAATVAELVRLRELGVVDQVLVADDSRDETPAIAQRLGAQVVRQRELHAQLGPVAGKGDAMWRALTACEGELICFVDGDSADFGARIPCGLVGAVALDGFRFAKGTYRRPFRDDRGAVPTGGGRVTELTAKPLLARLFPDLAGFSQPLAGEIAADADLLRSVPWATGYSVDVALLIDAWRLVGLGAMVEVDLDTRQNRHRPLHELGPMAGEVADAILDRARDPDGRLSADGTALPRLVQERPPLAQIDVPATRAENRAWHGSRHTATGRSSFAARSR